MKTTNTTPSQRFATFFIGGAADKNRFWLIGPQTRLIRRELVSRYFDLIASTPLGTRELNRDIDKAWFGYDEAEQLLAAIRLLHKANPGCTFRLIGHSLGAWRAAKVSAIMAQEGMTVSLLITLDPVGIAYFLRFPGNEALTPAPQATRWINILAQNISGEYGPDDAIADAGIKWHPARDPQLKQQPHFDYAVPCSHADIWKMMVFPGMAQRSAWQALTQVAP